MDLTQMRISLVALPVTLALALVVLFFRTRTLRPGDSLPELTVSTLEGNGASLRREGKKAILVFSTECPHCRDMALRLSDLYNAPAGGRIIGISLSGREATLRTVTELHLPFPVVLAEPALLHDIWGVRRVPTLVLVNGTGTVRHCYPGTQSQSFLARVLRQFDEEQ
jgi:peroxiredoxin